MEFVQIRTSISLNEWGQYAAPPLGTHPIEEQCPICGAEFMTCTGESHGPAQEVHPEVLEAVGIAGSDYSDPFERVDAGDERDPVRYDDGRVFDPEPDAGDHFFVPFG